MTDFLHFVLPGLPESKEKELAREILAALKHLPGKHEQASHGREGTSGDNSIIGHTEDGNEIVKIDKFDEFNTLPTGNIAVGIKGGNKGTILYNQGNNAHSSMVNKFDKSDSIDNYVRFTWRNDYQELRANTSFAGTLDPIKATDNIYLALNRLSNAGIPNSTKVIIYKQNIETGKIGAIETTVKNFGKSMKGN